MSKPKVEPLRLGRPKKQPEKPPSPEGIGLLWELMEMEAPEKFYVNGKDRPAFLLFPRGHWTSTKNGHSLYMNNVGLIGVFSSQKKAVERLKQIIQNANFPVKIYQVSKYGRKRGKHIFFAENTVQKVPLTPELVTEGAYVKVFNIKEWEGLAR